MRTPFRWLMAVAATGLFLMPLAPQAGAGEISEFTLSSSAPSGYTGPLVDPSWTPDDVSSLPSFAQYTVYLPPAADYYVAVVDGSWDFRVTGTPGAPIYATGCTSATNGCDNGWLNLFFVRDDRGDVPVGFSDPGPFSDPASHFATQADALAASEWHAFDVESNLLAGGPDPVPVTFYLYDVDYTDNVGDVTLEVYEGTPPSPPELSGSGPVTLDPDPIPEPPGAPLLASALLGLILVVRFRARRNPSIRPIG